MEHRCHDQRFEACSCRGCTRMCSCLMRDKMGMPCPIPNCRERAGGQALEKEDQDSGAQGIQMRFI